MVEVGRHKYRKTFIYFFLSYLICSQIWLNHHLDNPQFGNITKLTKKKERKKERKKEIVLHHVWLSNSSLKKYSKIHLTFLIK
jgi:hypothetical protein